MRKRGRQERGRRQHRRPTIRARILQFVRTLFSSRPSHGEWDDGPEGGLGVREPRRPFHPSLSGAVALEAPPEETRDVWAVGDEDRG